MSKSILSMLALTILLQGCGPDDGPDACTTDRRSAVLVHISSPDGLPIDDVRAKAQHDNACTRHRFDVDDAETHDYVDFVCWEDGGGTYVVTVRSGNKTWTQETDILADRCHVTNTKNLTFVLDAESAD